MSLTGAAVQVVRAGILCQTVGAQVVQIFTYVETAHW